MKYAEIKAYARDLRKNQTPSEAKLWKYLRKRNLEDRKFLRQHPVLYHFNKNEYFYFIPDFYCYQELLIIEIDGHIHDYQLEKDNKREAILRKTGFRILRFKNEELENIEQVLATIKSHFIN